MKAPAREVVIIVCSLALLVSCTKINLQGGKGGGAQKGRTNTASSATGLLGAGNQASQTTQSSGNQSQPLLDGEWQVAYEFNGNQYVGNAQFAQSGSQLSGDGADQDGKEWRVDNGQIQGSRIAFDKKYADPMKPPITYTGEIHYEQGADYTGWIIDGTYNMAGPDGKAISGKWTAAPSNPASAQGDTQAPPAEQPAASPFVGGNPAQVSERKPAPELIGDARPTDISGHYEGSFSFNFQKVKWKMWIESDGKKVSGHGYDVYGKVASNASAKAKGKDKEKASQQSSNEEHFTLEKGWYDYPNVTLVKQYIKGKGANDTRAVKFKGQLSSNGRDIIMKGETQFGGGWDAHRL